MTETETGTEEHSRRFCATLGPERLLEKGTTAGGYL